MNKKSRIELTCQNCSMVFSRRRSEYNRIIKEKRRTFCSIKCSSKYNNNLKEFIKTGNIFDIQKWQNLNGHPKLDEYSPFRQFMNRIKHLKNKKNIGDISLQHLREIWDEQDGICPFTKVKMTLKIGQRKGKITPYQASIDRIDSSKPYNNGNVRFVSYIANVARHNFLDDDLVEFCRLVAEANPK